MLTRDTSGHQSIKPVNGDNLRIGLYHSTLPEQGRKPGGVEQYVHRLAGRLQDRGHEVVVASFVRPPDSAQYRWRALHPAWIGRSRSGRIFGAPLLLNRRWESVADVLHLHGDDWFFFARDVATVRTFHGSARWEAAHADSALRCLSQAVVYPLEIVSSRLATHAYAVGPGNPPSYRVRGHLNVGVDVPDRPSVERASSPTVLFVGTWDGRKRGKWLHSLFDTVIRPALPSAELWMVSDRCEPGAGVTHFPAPDDDVLVTLYQRAWVFCLPSKYEGFGIPYLEAMANGAAVVSTPNPGARFLTRDGDAGVLAEDPDLGPAVLGLLRDLRAREALTQRGRVVANEFSWEVALKTHEGAYRAAIDAFRVKGGRRVRADRT